MRIIDYGECIRFFLSCNPNLTAEELGVLLLSDNIYDTSPDDLEEFRKMFSHLDPKAAKEFLSGITFLKIAANHNNEDETRKRLNDYINIKFNDVENPKPYSDNMKIFSKYSKIASFVISDILKTANFPSTLANHLSESSDVQECNDFYELFLLFHNSNDLRVKYEVLRKLGLIVLIARINRTFTLDELDDTLISVEKAFQKGLGLTFHDAKDYYVWIDENGKVASAENHTDAINLYSLSQKQRKENSLFPVNLEKVSCKPSTTKSGNKIINIEFRNKFKKNGVPTFTSITEKMIRKNYEFPNQVVDILGVKIIVEDEKDIPKTISGLEAFLGGTSTRKQEKNSYHMFGKKQLSRYSSDNYFVWKAIYDIALPHPSIATTTKMMKLTKFNKLAQQQLLKRYDFFLNHPRDHVIEVQLQDLRSYLYSMASGSPTEHSVLKMHQIRKNSYYKLFPKEIYSDAIKNLRINMLHLTKG